MQLAWPRSATLHPRCVTSPRPGRSSPPVCTACGGAVPGRGRWSASVRRVRGRGCVRRRQRGPGPMPRGGPDRAAKQPNVSPRRAPPAPPARRWWCTPRRRHSNGVTGHCSASRPSIPNTSSALMPLVHVFLRTSTHTHTRDRTSAPASCSSRPRHPLVCVHMRCIGVRDTASSGVQCAGGSWQPSIDGGHHLPLAARDPRPHLPAPLPGHRAQVGHFKAIQRFSQIREQTHQKLQ